jgi:hypothetical protein
MVAFVAHYTDEREGQRYDHGKRKHRTPLTWLVEINARQIPGCGSRAQSPLESSPGHKQPQPREQNPQEKDARKNQVRE